MTTPEPPTDFPSACMLFQGAHAHRSHRAFGDAVGADYRHFETGAAPQSNNQDLHSERARVRTALGLSSDYEIIIAEGTAPIQTAMMYKLATNSSATTLYLAADETFYASDGMSKRLLWRALYPATRWALDGIIAVGRDVYQWAVPYLCERAHEIVHPPISDEKHDRLSELSVSSPSSEFTILSAGTTKSTNNYPLLAAATRRLNDEGVLVQGVILGEGHPKEDYAENECVTTPGYVELDTFVDWFRQASVYIQPSVGDSFPVAALEGMLSGTPTLVTNGVGVRELLPDEQVVEPTVSGVVQGVSEMADMPQARRESLGRAQRPAVEPLTSANQTKEFQAAVWKFYCES